MFSMAFTCISSAVVAVSSGEHSRQMLAKTAAPVRVRVLLFRAPARRQIEGTHQSQRPPPLPARTSSQWLMVMPPCLACLGLLETMAAWSMHLHAAHPHTDDQPEFTTPTLVHSSQPASQPLPTSWQVWWLWLTRLACLNLRLACLMKSL